MTIIRYVICIRNIWRKGITLNYINIQQPVYSNVFLHGYLLQLVFAIHTLKFIRKSHLFIKIITYYMYYCKLDLLRAMYF